MHATRAVSREVLKGYRSTQAGKKDPNANKSKQEEKAHKALLFQLNLFKRYSIGCFIWTLIASFYWGLGGALTIGKTVYILPICHGAKTVMFPFQCVLRHARPPPPRPHIP